MLETIVRCDNCKTRVRFPRASVLVPGYGVVACMRVRGWTIVETILDKGPDLCATCSPKEDGTAGAFQGTPCLSSNRAHPPSHL